METNNSCIAKRLKEARLVFGISQRRLGILAGIDEVSASARINQYERDTHAPNFSILQRIAKVLGCPAAFFTSEDNLMAEIIYLVGKLPETGKQAVLNTAKQLLPLEDNLSNNCIIY